MIVVQIHQQRRWEVTFELNTIYKCKLILHKANIANPDNIDGSEIK